MRQVTKLDSTAAALMKEITTRPAKREAFFKDMEGTAKELGYDLSPRVAKQIAKLDFRDELPRRPRIDKQLQRFIRQVLVSGQDIDQLLKDPVGLAADIGFDLTPGGKKRITEITKLVEERIVAISPQIIIVGVAIAMIITRTPLPGARDGRGRGAVFQPADLDRL